jgi:hypothetical protein
MTLHHLAGAPRVARTLVGMIHRPRALLLWESVRTLVGSAGVDWTRNFNKLAGLSRVLLWEKQIHTRRIAFK